jgi:hypothetical protein
VWRRVRLAAWTSHPPMSLRRTQPAQMQVRKGPRQGKPTYRSLCHRDGASPQRSITSPPGPAGADTPIFPEPEAPVTLHPELEDLHTEATPPSQLSSDQSRRYVVWARLCWPRCGVGFGPARSVSASSTAHRRPATLRIRCLAAAPWTGRRKSATPAAYQISQPLVCVGE